MRRSNKKQATVEGWWMEGILGCGSLVTMIMSRCFVGLTGARVGGKIGGMGCGSCRLTSESYQHRGGGKGPDCQDPTTHCRTWAIDRANDDQLEITGPSQAVPGRMENVSKKATSKRQHKQGKTKNSNVLGISSPISGLLFVANVRPLYNTVNIKDAGHRILAASSIR
jgi:hypothetical protein